MAARPWRARLAERVLLFAARLPQDPAALERYDLILSSSVLHHLDDPAALWTSVRRWGPPGTPVFVFDLLRPQTAERVQEFVDENISGEPDVLQRDFRNSLFAAYSLDEVRRQLVGAQLDHLRAEHQVESRNHARGTVEGLGGGAGVVSPSRGVRSGQQH